MNVAQMNLLAGWIGMLGGVISGAVLGLFFHDDHWFGGYGSYRRRLLRLGHISFFGLGFINILYGLTLGQVTFAPQIASGIGASFLVGAGAMPICCFLAAWKKPLRQLFAIPVLAMGGALVAMLIGWCLR